MIDREITWSNVWLSEKMMCVKALCSLLTPAEM